MRAWDPRRSIARVAVDDIESPWPFDKTAPPRHAWGKDKVATVGKELPVVMRPDARDPENVHLYTSGTFDAQLAVSHDGVRWERFREPWVEPGHLDGLTLQLVSMTAGMIRRGRELRQYFVGWPHTHNRPVNWDRDLADREASKRRDLGGIYCATTRVDGFVALAAGGDEGTLTTRLLILHGRRLRLNIDTAGAGYASVAVLDERGAPLPGYAHADCDLIHADEIDCPVRWQGDPELKLAPREGVRLQFRMRNCRIWALEVVQ